MIIKVKTRNDDKRLPAYHPICLSPSLPGGSRSLHGGCRDVYDPNNDDDVYEDDDDGDDDDDYDLLY